MQKKYTAPGERCFAGCCGRLIKPGCVIEVVLMEKARTRYEKGEPVLLRTILPRVYAGKQWTHPWQVVRLAQEWPAVVGVETARLTAPAFLRRDTLWIYVQDSSWMHHFHFIKTDLLTRINQHLTEMKITDIRWQLQPEQPAVSTEQSFFHARAQARVIDSDFEHEVRRLTAGVANQECREALQRLWLTFAVNAQ